MLHTTISNIKQIHKYLVGNSYCYSTIGLRDKLKINPSNIWSGIPASTIALPSRYVQGNGIIKHTGNYLQLTSTRNCAIIVDDNCKSIVYDELNETLTNNNINSVWLKFNGECSYEEVERLNDLCLNEQNIDSIIAIGGGKSIDTGKLLAYYLDTPFISVPTIASNDAPVTSWSVVYNENNEFIDAAYLPRNPDLVIVDTNIIANAPVRYFKCGIADALSTYYEANAVFNNINARNFDGGRISLSILNWTKLSMEILFEYGIDATNAVQNKIVTDSLDKVIEASILLSGVGFQSGGLASAHSVAMAITNNKYIHNNWFHGEHVAVGLVSQLLIENNYDEAVKVMKFFNQLGLPYNLNSIGYDIDDVNNKDELESILETTVNLWVSSHSFNVTKQTVLDSFRHANEMEWKVL